MKETHNIKTVVANGELPRPGAKSRAALMSIISNTTLIITKCVVAFMTGSVSILSEALHSSLDLAAAVMAFFSVRAADKPADSVHPFGHGKFESVSGASEGILIILASGLIVREAWLRMISSEVEIIKSPLAGAAVMGLSVIVNIIVSRRLMRVAKKTDSIALEADAWHLLTDVYTSGGVLVGMIVLFIGQKLNWHFAQHLDPILAIAVALVILRAGWDITRQSYHHLVDRSMPEEEQKALVALLQEHYGQFINFHSLRTRQAGNQRHIDFHLLLPPQMPLEQAHDLCDHLETDIHTLLPTSEVLIHMEPAYRKRSFEQRPSSQS